MRLMHHVHLAQTLLNSALAEQVFRCTGMFTRSRRPETSTHNRMKDDECAHLRFFWSASISVRAPATLAGRRKNLRCALSCILLQIEIEMGHNFVNDSLMLSERSKYLRREIIKLSKANGGYPTAGLFRPSKYCCACMAVFSRLRTSSF